MKPWHLYLVLVGYNVVMFAINLVQQDTLGMVIYGLISILWMYGVVIWYKFEIDKVKNERR